MTKEELEKAKELFDNKHGFLDFLQSCDEWNKMNVPYKYIILWAKEIVKNDLDSINLEDIENKKDYEPNNHICLKLTVSLYRIYDYKLYDFFDRIVDLYKLFNHSKYLLFSETVGDDRDITHLTKFLINDTELMYADEKKYFDTGERFFGILPLLKQLNRLDLYNDILDVLFDFIENAGYYNKDTVKATYNYVNYLGDKNLIDRLIKCIKKLKINYQSLYPMWDFNEHKELHLDKEFEINSLKNIYYLLILDEAIGSSYKTYIDFRRNYIDKCINYFRLSKDIFSSCKDEVLPFIKNKLEQIEVFLNFDTSFVSLEKHSIYYKELLNDVASINERTLNRSLKEMITRFWTYYLVYTDLNDDNLSVINKCLKYFYDNNIFIFQYYDISDKIITKDGKDGVLIKYFNEGNKEIYNLYRRLTIEYVKIHYPKSLEFTNRLYNFAKAANDLELIEKCNKEIEKRKNFIWN